MAVIMGRALDLAAINSGAAALSGGLFSIMDNIDKYKAVLDGYTSAQLASAFPGPASTDYDILKSALTDMANLTTIWRGGAATGTMPRDHRLFAKQLLGNGLY